MFCNFFFQCIEDNTYNNHENDTVRKCLQNPKNCAEGFSMSLFYQQAETAEDYSRMDPDLYQREYLVSTGKNYLKMASFFFYGAF